MWLSYFLRFEGLKKEDSFLLSMPKADRHVPDAAKPTTTALSHIKAHMTNRVMKISSGSVR